MRTTPREVCSIDKEAFKLNRLQRSVLVGTILGDGGLRYKGHNCRLHIKHSARQLSLVRYKYKVFRNITSMEISEFTQTVGERDYGFAEFVTLTHREFTRYYNYFYPLNKKIVPDNIDKLLVDPLSLAVWFMDDGAADYAGASLQTHSFGKLDVEKLRRTLKLNFGLKTTSRLNKGWWIIYFLKSTMPRLHKQIDRYMLEDFKYKLVPYSVR